MVSGMRRRDTEGTHRHTVETMHEYKIGDMVEITGNGDGRAVVVVHGFDRGDKCEVVGLDGWGGTDHLLLMRNDLKQAVQREHVKPYTPRIPWHARLYRGIMGALFGPESHSVNRYGDGGAEKADKK